jgi:hypothetical protein
LNANLRSLRLSKAPGGMSDLSVGETRCRRNLVEIELVGGWLERDIKIPELQCPNRFNSWNDRILRVLLVKGKCSVMIPTYTSYIEVERFSRYHLSSQSQAVLITRDGEGENQVTPISTCFCYPFPAIQTIQSHMIHSFQRTTMSHNVITLPHSLSPVAP